MARSLHVKHEELPATSSLFNVFLLLAFAWLALTAIATASSAPPAEPVTLP